jgi:signal transduction histidine kinase
MEGEERERERIARELHDGIMVQFSSAQMNLSAMIERYHISDTAELESILVQLENATQELRKSAHNLMPDMLLQEGLAAATHYFCKTLQLSTGIKIDFHVIGTMPLIAPEYELMLYRMIQELLHNTIKHAKASYALVQINCHPDILSIIVEDNGVGFDSDAVKSQGMGIANLKSRIHSLNGNFSLTSNQQSGTSVYIELETKLLQSLNTLVDAN